MTKGKEIDDAINEWLTSTEIETVGFHIPKEEFREGCRGTLLIFNSAMSSLFRVSTLDAVSIVHIGSYYCAFRQMLTSGQWEKILSKFAQKTEGFRASDEDHVHYLEMQTDLLRRFFAFCWAQEYVSDQYLAWRWTPEELEKAARMKDRYVLPR